MAVLQTDKVTKQYRMGEVSVNALDRVDFTVEKGEFVAIMGPSGSGKSTLLHLLGGLDGASGGEVTLAGKPLSRLSDNEVTLVRRRNVGFIFQFYNLVPTLTAEEIAGIKLERTYLLDAPRGVAGRNSDNTFIQQVLSWEPNTPLKEGLKPTYSWIEQQYRDRKAGKRVVKD